MSAASFQVYPFWSRLDVDVASLETASSRYQLKKHNYNMHSGAAVDAVDSAAKARMIMMMMIVVVVLYSFLSPWPEI